MDHLIPLAKQPIKHPKKKRRLPHPADCPLCGKEEESIQRLLISCDCLTGLVDNFPVVGPHCHHTPNLAGGTGQLTRYLRRSGKGLIHSILLWLQKFRSITSTVSSFMQIQVSQWCGKQSQMGAFFGALLEQKDCMSYLPGTPLGQWSWFMVVWLHAMAGLLLVLSL